MNYCLILEAEFKEVKTDRDFIVCMLYSV